MIKSFLHLVSQQRKSSRYPWKRLIIMACLLLLFAIAATQAMAEEMDFLSVSVTQSAPSDPWEKAMADLSGDGQVDLIIGGPTGPLKMYVYPDWSEVTITGSGSYDSACGIAAADIDNDGDNDVTYGDFAAIGDEDLFDRHEGTRGSCSTGHGGPDGIGPSAPVLSAEMFGKMRHVVSGIGRRRDDLLGVHLPRHRQRPERCRTRPGPAIAENRTVTPLKRGPCILDHVRADASPAHGNEIIGKPGRLDRCFHFGMGRLVRRLAVGPVVDNGFEARGLDLCDILGPDLPGNAH